eukprot:TRINITY_DN10391_c0_g1_i1.p1 TRINITY_DN10391_c0_g1~~TRINITY_DN10391_c0_g1_i1.p1  ORF type:complete len:684 (-),score=111.84 TRINITY_DN10391_c0_g1_i1:562-2322(-)
MASISCQSGSSAFVISGGSLAIDGISFSDCIGTNGSAIISISSTVTVTNSTFINNQANWVGGAIYLSSSVASISSSVFLDNSVQASGLNASGGAIYADSASTLTISNCTFMRNTVTGAGGGLMSGGAVYAHTDLIASDSVFMLNSLSSGGEAAGGAISVHSGNATINGCSFISNSVTSVVQTGSSRTIYTAGGAVSIVSATNALYAHQLSQCGFLNNTVSLSCPSCVLPGSQMNVFAAGGALDVFSSPPHTSSSTVISSCIFSGNSVNGTAVAKGGAFRFTTDFDPYYFSTTNVSTLIQVFDSEFTDNVVYSQTGVSAGSAILIAVNDTVEAPGVQNINSAVAQIIGCSFMHNVALLAGGLGGLHDDVAAGALAMWFDSGSAATSVNVSECMFRANSVLSNATATGGAVHLSWQRTGTRAITFASNSFLKNFVSAASFAYGGAVSATNLQFITVIGISSASHATTSFFNCTFDQNSAIGIAETSAAGGHVHVDNYGLVLTESIFNETSSYLFTDCSFLNGYTGHVGVHGGSADGGAVYVNNYLLVSVDVTATYLSNAVTFQNCQFLSNAAQGLNGRGFGGAISVVH